MWRDGFRGLGHSARTARGCLTVDRKSSEGEGRPADRPTARRRLIDQDDLGEKQGRWLRGISTVEVMGGGDSFNENDGLTDVCP